MNSQNTNIHKTVVIVAGPTAVGKTAAAIEVAKHFGTEIISADSRQCFRELNIGVARPSSAELAAARHHFIASHSIREEVTAATFEQFALEKTNELFRDHDFVVMTGGTGLYLRAFCQGLDEIPAIDPEIRKRITVDYKEKGLTWLQQEIKEKDPAFYMKGEIHNPQRMMRALEVFESTGRSVLYYRTGKIQARDFRIVRIGLELPKEQLHSNIHARTHRMIEMGLVEEVKHLRDFKEANALRTVGYSEIFDHLDGRISLESAIDQIKTNTRRYAKRQMTWFRRDQEMNWLDPADIKGIIDAATSK